MHDESEEQSTNFILPGQTVKAHFREATSSDIDRFMQMLPPWFTEEMLSPGVPITIPGKDTTTVVHPDGSIGEAFPGAWDKTIKCESCLEPARSQEEPYCEKHWDKVNPPLKREGFWRRVAQLCTFSSRRKKEM